MDGEISETEESSFKEELDKLIPFHELLDVSASKSKAELAHKGAMSQRTKPSNEMRSAVLKRSLSAVSTKTTVLVKFPLKTIKLMSLSTV